MCCSSASVTLKDISWNTSLMNSTGTLKKSRFWYVMRNFTAEFTYSCWVLKSTHLVTKLQTNSDLLSKHQLSFCSFSHISTLDCKTQQCWGLWLTLQPECAVPPTAPSPAHQLCPTHAPEKAAVPTGNCILSMTKTEHVKSWNCLFFLNKQIHQLHWDYGTEGRTIQGLYSFFSQQWINSF